MAIETLSNPIPKFSHITGEGEYRPDAITDGYALECSCGELYRSVASAIHCRKCSSNSVFGYCTHVVDIRTMEVVAGQVPSQEAYRQAAMKHNSPLTRETKNNTSHGSSRLDRIRKQRQAVDALSAVASLDTDYECDHGKA